MGNNAPDYENLFFEKSIELNHSEKMRDYTAEYVVKLEEKLDIAKKAFNTLKTQIDFWHPKRNLAGSSVANYRLDTLREYIERTLTEIEE